MEVWYRVPIRFGYRVERAIVTTRTPVSVSFRHHVEGRSELTALCHSNDPLFVHILEFDLGRLQFIGWQGTDTTVDRVASGFDSMFDGVPRLLDQSWLCHVGEFFQ